MSDASNGKARKIKEKFLIGLAFLILRPYPA
jgi:hypothetical protein